MSEAEQAKGSGLNLSERLGQALGEKSAKNERRVKQSEVRADHL